MTKPIPILHVFHLLVFILCCACVENDDVTQPPPVDPCPYEDITGTCCVTDEADCTGICFGLGECKGCTDPEAMNYDPDAITEDNNCVYDGFADSTLWQLVWNDEFNESAIDPSKWNHQIWDPGMVNDELQAYTDRSNNSYLENGNLIIRALHENYDGAGYTSARMNSSGKGDFLYGKIDIKAKLPSAEGTWPAIWMLPTDWVYGGWPSSGEIDIMEHVGCNLDWVKGSVHTGDCNWNNGCPNQSAGGNGQDQHVPGASDNFNIYSIEWSESKIDFFVNNNHYWTFTNIGNESGMWPFDQKFHILLNIAVGGSWGGICPIDNSSFPQEMMVDFVRVYERIN